MSATSIPEPALAAILATVDTANGAVTRKYPGEPMRRQPVHTMYGGAQLFSPDAARKLGDIALAALRDYAPDPAALAEATGLDELMTARIYQRIVDKLTREPVEDLRVDFEDGFGNRSDEEEDRYAVAAANHVADGHAAGALPAGIGIRIKSLGDETKRRAVRTFDLFLTRLVERAGPALVPGLLLTLPKITSVEQVAALTRLCDTFERARSLAPGTLRFELMIETTQSIFTPDGAIALPHLVAAGQGRIVSAHFGTYDYTAACNITAAHQHMLHPACEFARHIMQAALAGTGVAASDGATNVLPIAPHRGSAASLSDVQRAENRRVVHRAWRLHADHVRHSLASGFYQGWDLHPAQLPTRYAAVYSFFLEGLDPASDRLKNFIRRAAQATAVGDVFDDAATGQGLLNYFLRAVNCGALTEDEAVVKSGLTLDELRGRSFLGILKRRATSPPKE